MKLFLVLEGERQVWVAAVTGEDVYTYVVNTGLFHVNEGVGDDYFGERRLEYRPIGFAEAKQFIASKVGLLDEHERAHPLAVFRKDPAAISPDAVLATAVADQN